MTEHRFPKKRRSERALDDYGDVYRLDLTEALGELGIAPGGGFEIVVVAVGAAVALPAPRPVTPPGVMSGKGQHRRNDGATARQAAADVAPRVGTQRHKVLVALNYDGPRTAEELVGMTGVEYRSITPRIGELKRAQMVRETGRTRLGTHGSEQAVIEITGTGRRAVGEPEPDAATGILFDA